MLEHPHQGGASEISPRENLGLEAEIDRAIATLEEPASGLVLQIENLERVRAAVIDQGDAAKRRELLDEFIDIAKDVSSLTQRLVERTERIEALRFIERE